MDETYDCLRSCPSYQEDVNGHRGKVKFLLKINKKVVKSQNLDYNGMGIREILPSLGRRCVNYE